MKLATFKTPDEVDSIINILSKSLYFLYMIGLRTVELQYYVSHGDLTGSEKSNCNYFFPGGYPRGLWTALINKDSSDCFGNECQDYFQWQDTDDELAGPAFNSRFGDKLVGDGMGNILLYGNGGVSWAGGYGEDERAGVVCMCEPSETGMVWV